LAVVAGFSEPDSPAYPLKRMAEKAMVNTAPTGAARADLEIKMAAQRLREAETMAARSRPDLATQAVALRYQELRTAARELAGTGPRDRAWHAVRDRFLAEAGLSTAALQHELTVRKQPGAATAVRIQAERFQAERAAIDARLAVPKPKTGTDTQPPAPSPPPGK
jgi:hypothetical protein